jgi:phytoene dehydrogenase-like protein
MQIFDQIIIGAGLSGLMQAVILAQEGCKVCLLEASPIPGGYLQTFSRKGYKFDVGFHYIGSTNIDKPLRKFFRYLQVFDKLPIRYYPDDCFYRVSSSEHDFSLPTSFAGFIEKLAHIFPAEQEAISKFHTLVTSITRSFRWYDLQQGASYLAPGSLSFPSCSIGKWLDDNIHDNWLKTILGVFSFHMGARTYEAPTINYCLCLDSIFDRPAWLLSGGDGLVQPLYRRARELGVDIRFRSPVVHLACENKRVLSVHTQNGDIFRSSWVISTIHPKQTVKLLDEHDLGTIFKDRMLDMKESRGSFGVYLTLKKDLQTIKPINYIYAVDNPLYEGFYFNSPSLLNHEPEKPRCSTFCFVESGPFMAFRGSNRGNRPRGYLDLKQKYTDSLLGDIKKFIPELEENVVDIYTSSPLTNEDYTGSVEGGAMGIAHTVEQQGLHRPQTFNRIKNLVFSGQSIYIPGICGVAINAFYSAAIILGEDRLFNKVASQPEKTE